MRLGLAIVLTTLVSACATEPPDAPTIIASNERIVFSDGLHNENTQLLRLDDRILLVFRGGSTGQVGDPSTWTSASPARIQVYASFDEGVTFTKQSEIDPTTLPDGRDIRDPKVIEFGGRLLLFAISRLPGGHFRDLFGVAWTVRAESTDHGVTWTPPVQTYNDARGDYFGFWRFTVRDYVEGGVAKQRLYATGYNDGDSIVSFFASDDGVSWSRVSDIIADEEAVPSEAELEFFGENQEIAVSIVRLDDQDIMQDGHSAICTAREPFTEWECGRRIDPRIDGPTFIRHVVDGEERHFVLARKHLPCTRKRTAIYELRGDLTDPSARIEVCEIQELPSSGDTAYTGAALLHDDTYLMSWYTSPPEDDMPWLRGTFTPSDIWLADIDLSLAPARCRHPAPRPAIACPAPPLPPGRGASEFSGTFLLAMAPVLWPEQTLYFDADVVVHDRLVDVTLQPLDAKTRAAAGATWTVNDVPMASDGSFSATFAPASVPSEVFPILGDPLLVVHEFTLHGKATSSDFFCGAVSGYGQALGTYLGERVSDRTQLGGSSFGAVRVVGASSPAPIAACPP